MAGVLYNRKTLQLSVHEQTTDGVRGTFEINLGHRIVSPPAWKRFGKKLLQRGDILISQLSNTFLARLGQNTDTFWRLVSRYVSRQVDLFSALLKALDNKEISQHMTIVWTTWEKVVGILPKD